MKTIQMTIRINFAIDIAVFKSPKNYTRNYLYPPKKCQYIENNKSRENVRGCYVYMLKLRSVLYHIHYRDCMLCMVGFLNMIQNKENELFGSKNWQMPKQQETDFGVCVVWRTLQNAT